MTRLARSIIIASVLAAGLSACGGGGGAPATTAPVVTPAVKLEDMFGSVFGMRFRTDPNTQATDPAATDVNAVSLTTNPVTI